MSETEDKLTFNMQPQNLMRKGETSDVQVGANITAPGSTL